MRVLLAFVAAGMGPRNQMRALARALRRLAPAADVELLDLAEADTTGALKRMIDMTQDWRYRTAHSKPMPITWRVRRKVIAARWARQQPRVRRQLLSHVRATRPDVVVAGTGAAGNMAMLKRRNLVDVPLVSTLADHVILGCDVLRECELHAAGSVVAGRQLEGMGIPRDRIVVTGIPIDPVYADGPSGGAILEELGLHDRQGRFLLIQTHSDFEDDSAGRLAKLLQVRTPCDIVVAGASDAASLASVGENGHGHRLRILGHSQRIPELFAAADLVVTKPGGLTTAQAMASGCALILRNPLPGYEQGNLEYLLETGCALRVFEEASLPLEIAALLSSRKRVQALQEAGRRAARPEAALSVAAHAISLASRQPVGSVGESSVSAPESPTPPVMLAKEGARKRRDYVNCSR